MYCFECLCMWDKLFFLTVMKKKQRSTTEYFMFWILWWCPWDTCTFRLGTILSRESLQIASLMLVVPAWNEYVTNPNVSTGRHLVHSKVAIASMCDVYRIIVALNLGVFTSIFWCNTTKLIVLLRICGHKTRSTISSGPIKNTGIGQCKNISRYLAETSLFCWFGCNTCVFCVPDSSSWLSQSAFSVYSELFMQ